MPKLLVPTLTAVFCLLQGCATFPGLSSRLDDRDAFLDALDERTDAALAQDHPFTLDRCIAVALENNLDVKKADLEARLAKLNRRIAFSNFLPEISLSYNHTELNEAPGSAIFGSMKTTVQDRIVNETAMNAQMPIFAPATWFLYALHRRGEEIGTIAADYTRQMIALQITGLYFQSLAVEEAQRVLEARHAAAKALAKEVEAFHGEGMATDADLAQIRVLVLAQENECARNARAKDRCLAELLTAMGLSPAAKLQLAPSTPLEKPEGSLEEWLLESLLNHPRLAAADRLAAIEREKVRIALADFLPALVGFASRSHTSNSFMAYPYASAFGFAGVMSIFNGFANVNEYRAARVEQEKAFLTREQESLALMLEVVRAHSRLEDSQADLKLAEAASTASEMMLKEETAKMREGLLRPSEMLDSAARHDAALVNAVAARYQNEVMIALARNVLGATHIGQKENNNE